MDLLGWLLIASALAAALFIVIRLSQRRRPARDAPGAASETMPHDCPPERVRVATVTSRLVLFGQAHVFEGVFCRLCSRELVCVKCGRFPEIGSMLSAEDLRGGVFACCESPAYRVVPGRRLDNEPEPRTGALN